MSTLRVISPGMLTTVQDLGRPGFASIGVPAGGAADAWSLRAGNALVGNPAGTAGLEMTIVGATVEFDDERLVAVTGGDAEVSIESGGARRAGEPWSVRRVGPGDRVRIGALTRGARAYLAVSGGVRVQEQLASAATLLSAGMGGFDGRPLRAGDDLALGKTAQSAGDRSDGGAQSAAANTIRAWLGERTLRVVNGHHAGDFDPAALAQLCGARRSGGGGGGGGGEGGEGGDDSVGAPRTVSSQSDRAGVRLAGDAIAVPSLAATLPSEPMLHGCIQVPPDGQPIILGVDHPTTGGYPVIACVISADLPILGQLRPGEAVRLRRVSRDEARGALRERSAILHLLEEHA